MSNFKVGDICYFRGKVLSSNEGKIFTLLEYIGASKELYPNDHKYWLTDCNFDTNLYGVPHGSTSLCSEKCMRKINNPGDEELDETLKIVKPKVKELEYAL